MARFSGSVQNCPQHGLAGEGVLVGDPSMTSDPLARFEAEHVEALEALDRLEGAARALQSGEAPEVPLRVIREVYQFLSTAVWRHNYMEEAALFPLLGMEGPQVVLADEHRDLRRLQRRLGSALRGAAAARTAPPLALELAERLRAHVQRENEVLFPWARAQLGPAGLELVAERCARVDKTLR